MSRDLAAVGEVMLDVSLPPPEPGRAIHAPVRVRAGGTPVNAALAAAGLGARAAVVGRVGADAAGAAVSATLAAAGVEALLTVDQRLATGSFVEAGDAVVADRGASAALAPDDVPDPLAAGAVLVSGYTLLHDDTAPAGRAALERARARFVAVTAVRGLERVHGRAAGANVLVANEAEAAALTGLPAEQAALELARGYEIACVTRGADGAVAASGGRLARGAALGPDLTGAGDAFAAALLVRLLRGAELAEAVGARLGG